MPSDQAVPVHGMRFDRLLYPSIHAMLTPSRILILGVITHRESSKSLTCIENLPSVLKRAAPVQYPPQPVLE